MVKLCLTPGKYLNDLHKKSCILVTNDSINGKICDVKPLNPVLSIVLNTPYEYGQLRLDQEREIGCRRWGPMVLECVMAYRARIFFQYFKVFLVALLCH